jgi:perosamine synthetase
MPTCEAVSLSARSLDAIRRYFADPDASTMHLCGTGVVAELESKLRNLYGMRYALCVSSATAGLLGIALALGLRGHEFVTSPYTYGGSLAPWLALGNQARFADVDPHLNIDPDHARGVISQATKALLAVDIFGVPSDTKSLRRLADEHGIWYVADAAQSLGSRRDGLPGSALADALVVSFTVGKTLFAGEGGAILTNHDWLYEKLLWHTQHPDRQRRELGLYVWNEFAFNARIHPLAAVWANATVEASLEVLEAHRRWCFRVIELLNESGYTEQIQFAERGILPSFFRLPASWRTKVKPRSLSRYLVENGIKAAVEPAPYRIVYRQPAFCAQYGVPEPPSCPVAECKENTRLCVDRVEEADSF